MRASILINDSLLLDLSPDIYAQRLLYGLDLSGIECLLLTHSHTDHLDAAELTRRSTTHYCHIPDEKPLLVYGNEACVRAIRSALKIEFGAEEDASLRVIKTEPWQTIRHDKLTITAIPAKHDEAEDCLLYLIREEGGDSLFYANDTALLPDAVIARLASLLKGSSLTYVSMDCTHGPERSSSGHMNIADLQRMIQQLQSHSCCDERTQYFATHFSHNAGLLQSELEALLQPLSIRPAWDGAVFESETSVSAK